MLKTLSIKNLSHTHMYANIRYGDIEKSTKKPKEAIAPCQSGEKP
jgi:hypothetical protein